MEMISQPRYLSGVRTTMSAVSNRLGFSCIDSSQIALAVDEAIANVIRHGYNQCGEERIWISIWPIESPECGIRILIEDEAQKVDPACIQSRELDEVRPGGLGVHIIQEIMDTVVYEHRENAGMRLLLEKFCPECPDPSDSEEVNNCCNDS